LSWRNDNACWELNRRPQAIRNILKHFVTESRVNGEAHDPKLAVQFDA